MTRPKTGKSSNIFGHIEIEQVQPGEFCVSRYDESIGTVCPDTYSRSLRAWPELIVMVRRHAGWPVAPIGRAV